MRHAEFFCDGAVREAFLDHLDGDLDVLSRAYA